MDLKKCAKAFGPIQEKNPINKYYNVTFAKICSTSYNCEMRALLPLEHQNIKQDNVIPYPIDSTGVFGDRYWQLEDTEENKQLVASRWYTNYTCLNVLTTSFIEQLELRITPEIIKLIIKAVITQLVNPSGGEEEVRYSNYGNVVTRDLFPKEPKALYLDIDKTRFAGTYVNLYSPYVNYQAMNSIIHKDNIFLESSGFFSCGAVIVGMCKTEGNTVFTKEMRDIFDRYNFFALSKYIIDSPVGKILNSWGLIKDKALSGFGVGDNNDAEVYFDIKTMKTINFEEFTKIKAKRLQKYLETKKIIGMPNNSFFLESLSKQLPGMESLNQKSQSGPTTDINGENVNKFLIDDVSSDAVSKCFNDLKFSFDLISDEEKAILFRTFNTHILGRSGSGKTTCLLARMWLDQCKGFAHRRRTKDKLFPRSLFLTVSPILANEVKSRFYSSGLGKLIIKEEQSVGFGDFNYSYDAGTDYIACYYRDHLRIPSFVALTLNSLIALIDICSDFPFLPEYCGLPLSPNFHSGFLENCDVSVRNIPNIMKGSLSEFVSSGPSGSSQTSFKFKGRPPALSTVIHRTRDPGATSITALKSTRASLYRLKMSIFERNETDSAPTFADKNVSSTFLHYLDYQTFHNNFYNLLLKKADTPPPAEIDLSVPLSIRGFIGYNKKGNAPKVEGGSLKELSSMIESYITSDVLFARFQNFNVDFISGSFSDSTKAFPGDDPLTSEIDSAIVELYAHFLAIKSSNNLFDLSDIIVYEASNIANGFGNRIFDRIYIDECQDFPLKAINLVKGVLRTDPAIGCIVAGDTAQNISRALTTKLANVFNQFTSREYPTTIHPYIALTKNYRCTQPVLDIAASVVQIISKRFPGSIDILPRERSIYDEEKSHCDRSAFHKPLVIWGKNSIKDPLNLITQLLLRSAFGRDGGSDAGATPLGPSGRAPDFGAHQCIIVPSGKAKANVNSALRSVLLVLSITESKGLEFDDTFLIGCCTNTMGAPAYLVNRYWRLLFTMLKGKEGRNELLSDRSVFDDLDSDNMVSCMSNWIMLLLKKIYVSLTRSRRSLIMIDGYDKTSYDIGASKKTSFLFNKKTVGGWAGAIHPLYQHWMENNMIDLIEVDDESELTDSQMALIQKVLHIARDESGSAVSPAGWLKLVQSLLLRSQLDAAADCILFAERVVKSDKDAQDVLDALKRQLEAYRIVGEVQKSYGEEEGEGNRPTNVNNEKQRLSKAAEILLGLNTTAGGEYSEFMPTNYKGVLLKCLTRAGRYEEAGDVSFESRSFSVASYYFLLSLSLDKLSRCLVEWAEARETKHCDSDDNNNKNSVDPLAITDVPTQSKTQAQTHSQKSSGDAESGKYEDEMIFQKEISQYLFFCSVLKYVNGRDTDVNSLFGLLLGALLETSNSVEQMRVSTSASTLSMELKVKATSAKEGVEIFVYNVRRLCLLFVSAVCDSAQTSRGMTAVMSVQAKELLDILLSESFIGEIEDAEEATMATKPINILATQLMSSSLCRLAQPPSALCQQDAELDAIREELWKTAIVSVSACLSEFILKGCDMSLPEDFTLFQVSRGLVDFAKTALSPMLSRSASCGRERVVCDVCGEESSSNTVDVCVAADGDNDDNHQNILNPERFLECVRICLIQFLIASPSDGTNGVQFADVYDVGISGPRKVQEALGLVVDFLVSERLQTNLVNVSSVIETLAATGATRPVSCPVITKFFGLKTKATDMGMIMGNVGASLKALDSLFVDVTKTFIACSKVSVAARLHTFSMLLKVFWNSKLIVEPLLGDGDYMAAVAAMIATGGADGALSLEEELETKEAVSELVSQLASIRLTLSSTQRGNIGVVALAAVVAHPEFKNKTILSFTGSDNAACLALSYIMTGEKGEIKRAITALAGTDEQSEHTTNNEQPSGEYNLGSNMGLSESMFGKLVRYVVTFGSCVDVMSLFLISKVLRNSDLSRFSDDPLGKITSTVRCFQGKYLIQQTQPSSFCSANLVRFVLNRFTEQDQFLLPPLHTLTVLDNTSQLSCSDTLLTVVNSLELLSVQKNQYIGNTKEKKEIDKYLKSLNEQMKKTRKLQRKYEKKYGIDISGF